MRNRGMESYKPDEYGDTIIVHRTIRDDGTTAYKIKAANGMYMCYVACKNVYHIKIVHENTRV